ncbi:MAG TPA: GNAT family N-acetyltransferase [Acidothermaceae bacterium]|jgi:GNAT superfamily N-acetyltransferase
MRSGDDAARERQRDADNDANRRAVTVRDRTSGNEATAGTEFVLEQVTSREDAERWQQIAQEHFETDYYEMPADPVQEIYERVTSTRSDDQYELWLGWLGPEAVVLGELRLPLLDNTDNAVVNVGTRPSYRRRGYGTAMLQHLTARARAHNRTRLIGEVGEPMPRGDTSQQESGEASSPASPPGVLFVTKFGARPVTSEVRRLLRIGDIDDVQLSRLNDDATAHSAEYSLIQWEGPAPAEVLDDLVVLHSRMTTDAPLEDLDWEPEQWTPQRYREREQRVIASGQVCLCTVARHDPSGQVVALTDLGLTAGHPEVAYQWATIVLPSHRGHRLGMLVKLANLAYLRSSRPQVRLLNTWNAAINDHMVSINEAIGFRPVERWREWQLELQDSTT